MLPVSSLDFISVLGDSTDEQQQSFADDAIARIMNGELPVETAKQYIERIHTMLNLIERHYIFHKLPADNPAGRFSSSL